jgi:hypothetical protein
MEKKSEVGWAGGGLIALLIILIKTSPKLVIAAAVGLNMGDFLAGVFPAMRNDIQQHKQDQLIAIDKERPSQISIPQVQQDPATLMSNRVFVYTTESPLSAAEDDYKKIAGTLARLQVRSLKSESNKYDLPVMMVNGNNSCKTSSSIGVYHPKCESIGVDFTDGNVAYEQDEEIIAALAHEWGHHLSHISGLKMSWNEGEIVSDCYAGLVMGYLHKNSLATKEEVENAGRMMIQIGNNSTTGIHPNSETRWKAFISAAATVTIPGGDQSGMYGAYCGSLDQIINKDRLINSSLYWS